MADWYFTNGYTREDGQEPPDFNQRGRGTQPQYTWWQLLEWETYRGIARREAYRQGGGKPWLPPDPPSEGTFEYADYLKAQHAIDNATREANELVEALDVDPCGVFSSKPTGEDWNIKAFACLANWYFWLSYEGRAQFLYDVKAGNCYRWVSEVFNMQRYCPTGTVNDPAYTAFLSSQLAGDDPANMNVAWNPMGGNKSFSPWPVVAANGQPIALPGLPTPCAPFPQCLASALPPGLPTPCSPWPDCAFDIAAQLAKAVPGARVVSTAEGGVYAPKPGQQVTYGDTIAPGPAEAAAKASAAPYFIAGLLGVTGIVLVGMAVSK